MWLVHPVIGALALVVLLLAGSQGLTSLTAAPPRARSARRWHRRLAPWAYGAILVSTALGLGSVLFLREDLAVGSTHLWLGMFASAALTGAALVRYGRPRLRRQHKWLGVLGLVAGVIQGVLGLGLLR